MPTIEGAAKTAVWSRIRTDAATMSLCGGRGPWYGHVPVDRNAPATLPSATQAVIEIEADTQLLPGRQEQIEIVLVIRSFSHDLNERVGTELDRLFKPAPRDRWRDLPVAGGGRASVRRESASDLPEPGSEHQQKRYLLRVMIALPGA